MREGSCVQGTKQLSDVDFESPSHLPVHWILTEDHCTLPGHTQNSALSMDSATAPTMYTPTYIKVSSASSHWVVVSHIEIISAHH